MHRLKMKLISTLAITLVTILAACGANQGEEENVLQEIDPPQEIEFINENEELDVDAMTGENEEIGDSVSDLDGDGEVDDEDVAVEEKGGGAAPATVMRELYLIDSNGFVAPLTMPINSGQNEIENIVNHLVHGGPITELLPSGFQAVLPSGTEILDVEVLNGVATINFSEQFNEYHPDQELKLLEALTWSVTQLDGVDRVKLKVNEEELTTMPKRGTPVAEGYTRKHGINLEMDDVEDITYTTSAVLYFISQHNENTYYVPVTRRIPNDGNKYEAIVEELLNGPNLMTPLLTDFREGVKLLEEPTFRNGTVTLNFNEALLNTMDGTAVSENILNVIVLSLTELAEVEEVSLQVESNESILVNSGENITEPVSRPKMVNTREF